MISLSENILKDEKFFLERCFVKRNNAYYFVAYEEGEKIYSCIKLCNKDDSSKLQIEVVEVATKMVDDYEEIVKEEVVLDKKYRDETLYEFFFYLSHIDNPNDVVFHQEIIDFIREYIEKDGYFYAEGNTLYGEFMELFKLKGKVVEGFYEGNLVLTDIALINEATGQIIKRYDDVNIATNFYLEEDDDADYMIEAYLENMSEYDIYMKFEEAMFDKKD